MKTSPSRGVFRYIVFALAALATLGEIRAVQAAKIYWIDARDSIDDLRIQRANFDGSNIEDLVVGSDVWNYTGRHSLGWPLAVDPVGGKFYWAYEFTHPNGDFDATIRRANLDGSHMEDFLGRDIGNGTWVDGTYSIAVDPYDRQIVTANGGTEQAFRFTVDGDYLGTVGGVTCWPCRIGLNVKRNEVYFAHYNDLSRVSYDNSQGGLVVNWEDGPYHVAVDPVGEKIYWSTDSGFWRANLDGTFVERYLDEEDVSFPDGFGTGHFVIDARGRMIYWTDLRNAIYRANIDDFYDGFDTSTELVVSGVHATTIALDVLPVPEPPSAFLATLAVSICVAMRRPGRSFVPTWMV